MLLEIGANRLSTDSNLFLFHPFVAQRQLVLHPNAEGTLENENLNYNFLRMVRRAKSSYPFLPQEPDEPFDSTPD